MLSVLMKFSPVLLVFIVCASHSVESNWSNSRAHLAFHLLILLLNVNEQN